MPRHVEREKIAEVELDRIIFCQLTAERLRSGLFLSLVLNLSLYRYALHHRLSCTRKRLRWAPTWVTSCVRPDQTCLLFFTIWCLDDFMTAWHCSGTTAWDNSVGLTPFSLVLASLLFCLIKRWIVDVSRSLLPNIWSRPTLMAVGAVSWEWDTLATSRLLLHPLVHDF